MFTISDSYPKRKWLVLSKRLSLANVTATLVESRLFHSLKLVWFENECYLVYNSCFIKSCDSLSLLSWNKVILVLFIGRVWYAKGSFDINKVIYEL